MPTLTTTQRALRLLAHTAALAAGYKGELPLGNLRAPNGKFQGEPYYVAYFYDRMLTGDETQILYDDGVPIVVFDVDADDRAAFSLDSDTVAVALWETNDGFVMFAEWDQRQHDAAEADDSEGEDLNS